ncbi:hypothetical protein [Neobacillus ginsengisoli]|uniref:Uncharacterized protein n=1 Tax=Neobacillus ginsengisoli TaxID=904295 RepID=A0ABT9XUZ1_9BACI|nr:hypothetical protein [Neobacillus ginsengisoli]MDQ0199126.1 hypothetical protein [Neobacillus ginsengisoli]
MMMPSILFFLIVPATIFVRFCRPKGEKSASESQFELRKTSAIVKLTIGGTDKDQFFSVFQTQ